MKVLSEFETMLVAGGEASSSGDAWGGWFGWGSYDYLASTGDFARMDRGQGSSTTQSFCYTVQVGPVTIQTCYNDDNTTSVQSCLQAGPSGSVGGLGLGITGALCETTTSPNR